MKCPRCDGAELVQEVVDRLVVEKCPDCGGMWFDQASFDKVSDSPPAQLVDADRPRREPSDSTELACPACMGRLIKLSSVDNPAVAAYGCAVCYGRWIDGGQMALMGRKGLFGRLRDFIRRHCQ